MVIVVVMLGAVPVVVTVYVISESVARCVSANVAYAGVIAFAVTVASGGGGGVCAKADVAQQQIAIIAMH